MPGLVVFRRRWSVGSDDLVVPGAFLLLIHFICFVIVSIALLVFQYDATVLSTTLLWYHQVGYLVILMLSICTEAGICVVSMRGSILDSGVRTTINLWIYIKSLIIFFDITWLVLGTLWLVNYYIESPVDQEKKLFIAIIICNWTLLFITIITIWCTFDAAGRSWVKMKKYQRSMRETESRFNYKRSNSMNRNWRQRKVIRAYQDSWDHRCRLLFCCMGSSERNRNSFTDIARLLSDFFRELDVVPSDVVAGLVLLRKFQKLEREAIVRQKKNGTYEFLSGVPITERTQFLALNDTKNYDFFQTVIHYMYFAQGAYGWPMYFIINRSKMWHLVPEMKCFGCCCGHGDDPEIIQDNCCYCNYAALKKTLQVSDTEITYVTYHVDVGETPFFVAIDYSQKKVVVSIRGTLSMKDILTDLNAEGDVLPLDPPRDDWLGHKGMVQAAIYIRNKLLEENLIEKALNRNPDRSTHTFGLVLVGHSLGAGTAAILAILMKPHYPSLQCFSYSPPGGLLSMPAVEYSKSFITSVVLGKDVVPRIGLYQMEALRADLINAIQRSVDPKWKTISCSVVCCGCGPEPTSVVEMSEKDTRITQYQKQRDTARSNSSHPTDSSIALTLHQPLYPPGRIIHIVRHHPKPDEQNYDSGWRNVLKSREPVYQAIWAETTDFDEVLISPVMLQDHMPDQVLAALKKVVTASGPRKPQRQSSNAFSTTSNDVNFNYADPISIIPTHRSCSNISQTGTLSPTTHHKVCLETSFTNLQSPLDIYSYQGSSKASSIADSIAGRTHLSSAQYEISSIMEDSITIVTRRSPSVPSDTATVVTNEHEYPLDTGSVNDNHHRLKAVAFDMDSNSAAITRVPSPQIPPRSILHRQFSVRDARKPKTLPFPPLRRASDVDDTAKIVHDDWFGLAPLASPETLSEISSISSRTPSAPISLANSIERYLHNLSSVKDNEHKHLLEDIFESQLHTPKVMRRAPKFSENLSKCAENSKNVDQYKRMGRVFITFPQILPSQGTSIDSSDDSFESAQSLSKIPQENLVRPNNSIINSRCQRQSSMSADQLKDDTQTAVSGGAGLNTKLTLSDSQILNDNCASSCPNCPCHRNDRGTSTVCCLKANHNNCSSALSQSQMNNIHISESKETTFYSANSSVEKFLTPRKTPSELSHLPKPNDSIRPGVLESHFPVISTVDQTRDCLTKLQSQNVVGGRVRKRLSSEEFIFSCNEEPSSIVQILDNYVGSSCNSSNGRKRKGCVYPANSNSIKITTQTTQFLSDSPKSHTSGLNKSHESSV